MHIYYTHTHVRFLGYIYAWTYIYIYTHIYYSIPLNFHKIYTISEIKIDLVKEQTTRSSITVLYLLLPLKKIIQKNEWTVKKSVNNKT